MRAATTTVPRRPTTGVTRVAGPAAVAPHGSPLAGLDARAMLESLSVTEAEARPPTLLLHLLNAVLGCQWSAVHAAGPDGKLKLLALAAASSAGGSVGLFDFLGHDTERAAAALADKAIRLGTQAPARGSVSGLLHCAPLAVPLLDAGGAGVGCVTLLCKEASRVYSRDEQALVATIGPLLSLHATRASLREQAVWMASLGGEGGADAQMLAERVSRVVMDLKAVHAAEMARKQADWEQERDAIESSAAAREAAWAASQNRLQAETQAKDLTLAAAVEGLVKSQQAEIAALVTKHREELAVARGMPRQARQAEVPPPVLPQGQALAPAAPLDSTQNRATTDPLNRSNPWGAGEGVLPSPQGGLAPPPAPAATDSFFGTASISGRPIPKGALVAAAPAPRTFKPQLDLPKSSAPLPPPLPSNWERHVLSGGKLAMLVEALPGPEAPEEEEGGYRFYVETCSFHQVEFTLDFSGSSNYVITFSGPRAISHSATAGAVTVGPYLREPLARLKIDDRYADALLSYTMSWRVGEPDAKAVEAEREKEGERLRAIIEAAVARQKGTMDVREAPHASDKVRRALLKPTPTAKHLPPPSFIDLDFPPIAESIGAAETATSPGTVAAGAQPPPKPGIESACTWRRPVEFLAATGQTPRVFVDGLAPSDVMQGSLGNCWFMCSLAALAEFPALIHSLFLDDWPCGTPTAADARPAADASGLYRLRLSKHGQWVDVAVDDFFPCRPGSGPVFSQAHGPELWVLLLEKAYAKLHGSYLSLRSGMCYEGLADLTGAPCLYRRLDEEDDPDTEIEEKPVTFADLQRYDRNNFVVCCSTPGQDQMTEGGRPSDQDGGLVPGHAYSLISARRLRSGAEILKLRNPWGTFEWQGAWSDNSPEMTDAVRAELDAEEDDGEAEAAANDGSFWMSFEDFRRYFVSISVAMAHVPQPPSACAASGVPKHKNSAPLPWSSSLVQRVKTILTPQPQSHAKPAAVGAHPAPPAAAPPPPLRPSHMFALEVKPSREPMVAVTVGVHQVDQRCNPTLPNLDVGIAVLRRSPDGSLSLAGSVCSSVARDRNLELELGPGSYLVVPTTSGAVPAAVGANEAAGGAEGARGLVGGSGDLTARARRALDLIAFTLDGDMDGLLGEADLLQPAASRLVTAAGIDTSPTGDGFGSVKLSSFPNRKLTPAALRLALVRSLSDASPAEAERFWAELFAECGWGGEGLTPAPDAPRPLVVSVHTGEAVVFTPVPYEAETYDAVLCEMIRAKGKEMVVGKVRVYALGSPGGVSFAAVNTDPSRAYELTLDASSSLNVRSHRNTLVATTILPPASASPSPLLLLVLLPIDRFESWSYSYKVSCYAPKARVPLPTLPSTAPRGGRPIAAAPRVAAAPRHPSAAPPPPPAARAVAKARPAGGATATAATATLRPVE